MPKKKEQKIVRHVSKEIPTGLTWGQVVDRAHGVHPDSPVFTVFNGFFGEEVVLRITNVRLVMNDPGKPDVVEILVQ